MKRLALLSLLFLLAVACDRKEVHMPERLLNEQEMISIMTDLQIIEADINYQKTQEHEQQEKDSVKTASKDYVKMSRDYYAQLFEHYGITDSIFSQNMRYYTERPDVLEKIMDSVLQRLTKEQSTSSIQ